MQPRFGLPALRLITNAEIEQRDRQQAASLAGVPNAVTGGEQPMDELARHCRAEYQAAYDAKTANIQERMFEDLRQIRGEYDPADLAEITKQGSTPIFLQLTAEKYYGALSWVTDLLTQERPFGCEPTPISTIPGEVQAEIVAQSQADLEAAGMLYAPGALASRIRWYNEEVKRRVKEVATQAARHAEDVVDDLWTEGDAYPALLAAAEDGIGLGTGILAGPCVRMQYAMEWGPQPGMDQAVLKAKRSWYALSPLDAFPSAGAREIDEGSFTERQRWSRADFNAVMGIKGFREDKVREILERFASGGRREWMSLDTTRAVLENRAQEFIRNTEGFIDVARHFTSVPARLLQQWGMSGAESFDPIAEVPIECYFVDSIVFGAKVIDDPLRKRPYSVWRFRPVRGSFWGESLPRSMRSIQRICNAAARALCDNMGMASGPMIEIETDRLAAGEKVTQVYPWRVWQTVRNPNGSPGAAVRAIQTSMYGDQLLGVMQHFMPLADRLTGIPAYSYGVPETRGAANTSSGLAQIRADAARGLKRIMSSLDNAIARSVELTIRHVRKFPDPSVPPIEGDVNVKGKGTQALVTRETEQARMVELLAQTANPIDAQVFGPRYPRLRTELWRGALRHFNGIEQDELLPSRDEVRAMELMMTGQQPPGAAGPGGMPGGPGEAPGGPPQPPRPRSMDPSGAPAGGVDGNLL